MSKKVIHYAHFTTLGALKSMLDSQNNNQLLHFRATIYNQLNDGNEGLILRNKYFTTNKKKTEKQIDFNNWVKTNGEPFIISFIEANIGNSAKGISKNVTMWQNYGSNGKGIVLVFDFYDTEFNGWKLIKCDYLSNTDANDMVKNLNKLNNIENKVLNEIFIKTKDKEWEHEKEWRLYKNCKLKEISTYAKTPHRIIEYSYIDIPLSNLNRIIIGNQLENEVTKNVITHLLQKAGYNEQLKIEHSNLNLKD